MISAAAIVSDKALKNAPVTPVRKASGRKTSSVAMLDPVNGGRNSRPAASTASRPLAKASLAPVRRARCSTMVITSSITRPTAAARPPSVMMLNDMPSMNSSSTVVASVAGTTSIATSVTRKLRRKASSTRPANPSPIRIASRTLPVDSVTSVLWSYQFTSRTSGGSRG